MLQERIAVDELGFGIIRDAFADAFFPATSTIQTRAKYFLLIPYILKEATSGKYGYSPKVVRAKIDDLVAHVFHGVFPCCCIPSPSIGTYRVDSFGKGYDNDFAIEKEGYRSCLEVNAGFLPRKE